jgi:peptide/nickel transport system substrate-binding protein
MRRRPRKAVTVVIAALTTVALAACGSSSGSSTSTSSSGAASVPLKKGENPVGQQLYGKKKGGTLTVYSSEDFEHLDPGEAYFVQDYAIMYATQRPLFAYPPNSSSKLVPDLATAIPTTSNGGITDGGKTVTVHIRPNVHFSPPVNRAVTSSDVAYAIERGANPNVANPYFPSYFGAGSPTPIVGAATAKGGPIPGIQTPNKTTIVFHLTKPGAPLLINALSLPISMPVPKSFAGPMDKHAPTTYGTQAEVFTGPYMLKNNPKNGVFAGIGYQTGKSATLVRNPNWNPNTYSSVYHPPAYLNRININIGGDATVIGNQVLKGSDSIQLDTPAQSIVKLAYQSYPSQITFTTGSGDHYVGINNAHGPFKNEDLRKAVWAQLDREAIVKARGGPLVAEPMTHFIYPGNNGFAQAGGYKGPQVDYNVNPNGNHKVACKYMKLAGYASCKYTGNATVQIVGANNGNDPAVIQIVNNAFTALVFKTHVSEVDQSTMYAKYCGVPKQEIDACPTVGWIRDFADPLSVLYAPFYGPGIVPTNNSNWSQANWQDAPNGPNKGKPTTPIDKAMVSASLVNNPSARAQAWANVDKMLVNEAVAIPEEWDNQPNIRSKDVAGVDQLWDIGQWDFMFTSLQNP